MKNFIILFLIVFSAKVYTQGVYILTFENATQNSTHFSWDVRIRAVSAPFVLLSSNIRYNFNNSALNTTTVPTFDVTLPGYAFDASSFLGTVPNRYVNLGFGPTSQASADTITTSGVVIGTISHPRGPGNVNGLPTNTRIRAWNVPGYVNNLPTGSNPNAYTLIFTLDSPSTPVQAGLPENLSNILLPINLKNFSAEKAGERMSRLYWISSSEINASHYEIERSLDAIHFEKLGDVTAVNNATGDTSYEFYDKKIPSIRTNTIIYYRLKMVDLDGSFEYSDIRGVNFDNDLLTGVTMYPNPTSQFLNLDINEVSFAEENGELQIFDALGKLVLTKKVIGSGIETIDMGRMTNGVYHVVLTQGEQMFREKIVKID